MKCDQGIDVIALSMDADPPMCVVVGKLDGKQQSCVIDAWFQDGVEAPLQSHVLADYFAITVHGFDKDGDEASSVYHPRLEGLGQAIHRDAHGRFENRAAQRMETRFLESAARLPAVFDKHGA